MQTGSYLLWRKTVLFTNGVDNWWYISNLASHRFTPWMFLTSRRGNPAFFLNRTNSLFCSPAKLTCIHKVAVVQFSAWCYSVSFACLTPEEAKGCPYKFTQAKRSILYEGKRPPCVHESPLIVAAIWSVGFSSALRALLYSKAWSKATTTTMRLLHRASGYETKGPVGMNQLANSLANRVGLINYRAALWLSLSKLVDVYKDIPEK